MTVRFTIDDKPFEELAEKLGGGAAERALEDISVAMAEEALSQVRDGWKKSADPYGKGWAAKKRDDGRRILVGKTGNLQGSWNRKRANATGFEIESGKDYSGFHQDGFKTRRGTGKKAFRVGSLAKVPARKMVPEEGDISPTWEKAFDEVAEDVLDELFGE